MDNRENYFNSQEFHDLLSRYESSLQDGSPYLFSSEELTNIAEYYYNSGDPQKSSDTLDYALSIYPHATLPLVSKARIALIDEKDASKARHFAELVENPYDLDCLYIKAEIMLSEGHTTDADALLQDAIDHIDDDDIADYILDVATLFVDYNDADHAQLWLDRSDDFDLADYKELKARIAYIKGKYEQSAQIFEQLLDEDPYSGYYWNSLASSQLMNNHFNDAITSSEYSIAINPNDEEAIFNKANALFSLGNYEEAMKYYERFNKLCPEDGTGTMFVGNCLLNMGHADKALTYYEKALAYFESQGARMFDITQCLIFCYAELKEYDKVMTCLDKAMAMPEVNRPDLLVIRGHIMLEKGNIKEAINNYMEALKESAYSHYIFFRIAISVYDCGYISIAYRMFKSYIGMHGDEGDEGASYLAYCCLKMGRDNEYLKYLKLATTINPIEAQKVLGNLFPANMSPNDYYDYALQGLSDNNKSH